MVKVIRLTNKDKKECPTHGTFVNSFKTIIQEDCDCYADGKLLFKFRKNAISEKDSQIALRNFLSHAKKPNDNRGVAAGVFEDGKAKRKVGNFSRGNICNSAIIGYYDKPIPQQKSELKKEFGKVPDVVCRQTAFNNKHPQKFEEAIPFFESIDKVYEKTCNSFYKKQRKYCDKINPQFVVGNTTFTTITCNYNWQTAIHTDKGDYPDGLGNITVVGTDDYDGGYTGFPEWDLGVDVRSGDVVIADIHQPHCNTPMTNKKPGSIRLSFVSYLRTDMLKGEIPYKDGKMYVSKVVK